MDTVRREPTSVGEMLKEEFYRQSRITPERLADALGVSIPDLEQLMRGNRRLSAVEAVALGELFDMGDFWINLQASHDRWEERTAKGEPL